MDNELHQNKSWLVMMIANLFYMRYEAFSQPAAYQRLRGISLAAYPVLAMSFLTFHIASVSATNRNRLSAT